SIARPSSGQLRNLLFSPHLTALAPVLTSTASTGARLRHLLRSTLMSKFSRRDVLKTALSGATMAALSSSAWPQADKPIVRKANIKQSVSRWCYKQIPLEKLCEYSAHIGLKAVDLLEVSEWEVPRRYGLICSMGYAGGGDIPHALNRIENHAKI